MKRVLSSLTGSLVLVLTMLWRVSAAAQITPHQDAFTNSSAATTNYGANSLLNVDGAQEATYIQFDLSSIPPGASVAHATLKIYVNAVTTAGTSNVDYVTASWVEDSITYDLSPTLGAAIASNVSISSTDENQYVLIDVTPALIAWLSGSQPNDGLALVANGSFSASFDSKENTGTSHPPELDVVFSPGGGSITGVLTGSESGLVGGGTGGTLNLSLTNSCSSNQILQWNASAWVCSAAGAGTITGVSAGTDLTGGGTSGNVTLNLDTTQVPQLNTDNTFTQGMAIAGNVNSGSMSTAYGYMFANATVNANGYYIGSSPIAFGSFGNENAYLGFAGTITASGGNGKANTAAGFQALYNASSGTGNVALGTLALYDDTTGSSNTACGAYALALNTTANNNSATGYEALFSNASGSFNTADGVYALYANTSGAQNVALGDSALTANTTGQQNTAVGDRALLYNTTGNYNTAAGAVAISTDTGAESENTGIGAFALVSSSGNDLTCIGYSCNANKDAVTNATAVGAHALVSRSNSLVLGGTGEYAVKVGIGVEAPISSLTIARGSGHPLSDGWQTYSSRRWKTHIGTLPNALATVERLRGVSYERKENGKREIGLIAEEVGKIVPEVVTYESNGEDALGVDYGRLTALLIEAVKQEQREILRTRKELSRLAARDAKVDAGLTDLENNRRPELQFSGTVAH